MRRALAILVFLLAGAPAGCGGSSSTPTPTAASATPSATATPATPTPTPSVSFSASPTPSTATLVIQEYGVALTLPKEVADATYRIDSSMAGSTEDANGTTYTELPGVRVWTASLVADPKCSSLKQDGLVAISVFPSDPSALDIPDGPSHLKHIGQYWFGISQEQAYSCSDGNGSEWPSVIALVQAFDSLYMV
jgi:hypothetical protein